MTTFEQEPKLTSFEQAFADHIPEEERTALFYYLFARTFPEIISVVDKVWRTDCPTCGDKDDVDEACPTCMGLGYIKVEDFVFPQEVLDLISSALTTPFDWEKRMLLLSARVDVNVDPKGRASALLSNLISIEMEKKKLHHDKLMAALRWKPDLYWETMNKLVSSNLVHKNIKHKKMSFTVNMAECERLSSSLTSIEGDYSEQQK